jgi:hypothetical protein
MEKSNRKMTLRGIALLKKGWFKETGKTNLRGSHTCGHKEATFNLKGGTTDETY